MSNVKTFKPNGNRVFVELDEADNKTAGGLHIPEIAERGLTFKWGTVAFSPMRYNVGGDEVLSSFNVGDRVLVDALGGSKLELDGKTYMVLRHEDIVGKRVVVP